MEDDEETSSSANVEDVQHKGTTPSQIYQAYKWTKNFLLRNGAARVEDQSNKSQGPTAPDQFNGRQGQDSAARVEDQTRAMPMLNPKINQIKTVNLPFTNREDMPPSREFKQQTNERWELIKTLLMTCKLTHDSDNLQDAIFEYNRGQYKWKFDALYNYSTDQKVIFRFVTPKIIKLALDLPELVTKPLPLLTQGVEAKVTLNQEQIAALLANAFLCTFARRGPLLPTINFDRMFQEDNQRKREKLKCVYNYFERVTTNCSKNLVTFQRLVVDPGSFPDFWTSEKQLCELVVSSTGSIEDADDDVLQVDFANKLIGGGVLNRGLVQEEIRMMTNPELIVARLFTEELQDNEALLMVGSECYSTYSGYSNSFRFERNYVDPPPPETITPEPEEDMAQPVDGLSKPEEEKNTQKVYNNNLEGKNPSEVAEAKPEEGTNPSEVAEAKPEDGTNPSEVAEAKPDDGTNPSEVADAKPDEDTNPSEVADAKPDEDTNPSEVADAKPDDGTNLMDVVNEEPDEGTNISEVGTNSQEVAKEISAEDIRKSFAETTDLLPDGGGIHRKCAIVAIDATRFRPSEFARQFEPAAILRETKKAYVGFRASGFRPSAPVATGNWGCGAFNGDPRLKALVQILAATEAGRSLIYFTYGDEALARDIKAFHGMMVEAQVTVGTLFQKMTAYKFNRRRTLYEMLTAKFNQSKKVRPVPKTPGFEKLSHTGDKSVKRQLDSVITIPCASIEDKKDIQQNKEATTVDIQGNTQARRVDSQENTEASSVDSQENTEARRIDSQGYTKARRDEIQGNTEAWRVDSQGNTEASSVDSQENTEARRIDSQGDIEARTGEIQGNTEARRDDSQGNTEARRVDSQENTEARRNDSQGDTEAWRVDSQENTEARRVDSQGNTEARREDSQGNIEARRVDRQENTEAKMDEIQGNKEAGTCEIQGDKGARRDDSQGNTEARRVDSQENTEAVTGEIQGITEARACDIQGNTEARSVDSQENTEARRNDSQGDTEAWRVDSQGNTEARRVDRQENTEAKIDEIQGNKEAGMCEIQGDTEARIDDSQGNTEARRVDSQENTEAGTGEIQGNTEARTVDIQGNTEARTGDIQGNTEAMTGEIQGITEARTGEIRGNTVARTGEIPRNTEAGTVDIQGNTEARTDDIQ